MDKMPEKDLKAMRLMVATAAMNGLLASDPGMGKLSREEFELGVSVSSFRIADAMLKAGEIK